jgi:hypothetical protein
MSAQRTFMQLATKAAIGFGALFLVGVLLAAMPNHHPPAQVVDPNALQEQQPAQDHSSMPGMKMPMDDGKSNEAAAVHDMEHMGHGMNAHMQMTEHRAGSPADQQKADEIVVQLRAAIEKYKDYHVALNDGFKIFLPNVPQPEYHFTSMTNGFMATFGFDPKRPTSLLYKKTATGYELVGAMYTMPKSASEDQLNARVPLSLATWHLHTNLCMPPRGQRLTADYTKFGLHGSIITEDACDDAGGKFYPVVFGWMVHVYPYQDSTDKIFAMHMD